jgi:hypothetical protein
VDRVGVPVVAVHEDHDLASGEHDVWRASWRQLTMKPETGALGVETLPQQDLGFGIYLAAAM